MIREYLESDKNAIKHIGSSLRSFDINKCNELDKIKVFEKDGNILGFIIYRVSYDVVDILYVAVDEQHRNKSVGTKLVESLRAINNVNRIMLEVSVKNETAIKFYKKNGFEQIRTIKNYYDGKIDAVAMEKVIK